MADLGFFERFGEFGQKKSLKAVTCSAFGEFDIIKGKEQKIVWGLIVLSA